MSKFKVVKLKGSLSVGQGMSGESAYETWLSLGNIGSKEDFILSLRGEKGDTGEIGPIGPIGPKGEDGKTEKCIIHCKPRAEGETDDTNALKNTISSLKDNDVLVLDRDLIINYVVVIDKSITIDGQGFKVISDRIEANIIFNIKANNTIIKNINFDNNLKCRTTIKIKDCNNILIENCSFTGYTKEYGYSPTDAAILIDGTVDTVNIIKCKFNEFAYQYPNLTENLVRCITINTSDSGHTVDTVNVNNCTFNKVSQAIVGGCNVLRVTDCDFNHVKDNCIYGSFGYSFTSDCIFRNGEDEGIVATGGYFIVKGCMFNNIKNKAIGIKALVKGMNVDSCYFINDTLTTGQVLVCREEVGVATGQLNGLKFINNTVRYGALETEYPLFQIGNVDSGIFDGNIISAKLVKNAYIFRFNGTYGTFKLTNNVFKNIRSGGTANMIIFNDNSTTSNFLYQGNVHENSPSPIYLQLDSRIIFRGYEINTSVASIVKNYRKREFYSDTLPTFTGFKWYKGDRIHKINTDTNSNVIGWVAVSDGTSPTWKTITRD